LDEPLTDPKLFLHDSDDDLNNSENYRANLLTKEINEQLVPEFQEIAEPNAVFVKYEKNCEPFSANTQKSVCTIDTVFQAKDPDTSLTPAEVTRINDEIAATLERLADEGPADGQIRIVDSVDPNKKMDPNNPNYVNPLSNFTIAKRQPKNVFNTNLIIVVVCSVGGALIGVIAVILGCMCYKRAEVALARAQVDDTVLMDRKFREKMGVTLPEEAFYGNYDNSAIEKSQPYFTA
jgi:hypothetical protein